MRLAAIVGAVTCGAGLMAHAWRALVFIVWPNGPEALQHALRATGSFLLYPGVHVAGWMAEAFAGGSSASYLPLMFFGLVGVVVNFAMWTGIAYLALRAGGAVDRSRE